MIEHTEDEARYQTDAALNACECGANSGPCPACVAELDDREAQADAEAFAYRQREDRDR